MSYYRGGIVKKRSDLIYPKLSYKINSLLFKVFKNLGQGHLERHYQNYLKELLVEEKIIFEKEKYLPIEMGKYKLGKRYADFVIEDRLVIELKKGQFISSFTIQQTLDYLKILNFKLGLIACFTSTGVYIKRIVNLY